MMTIFGQRKKDQEIVVIKLNLKKENHYTLPIMP
jgi:hypothetical protein